MIPGFSRNWRRTSSTTWPPALPTASMENAANRNGIMPPMKSPITTNGFTRLKLTVSTAPSPIVSASSST